jgi:outer membrane protein assembly factor BamE (lipoprotein component of BamABCDE complex)
MRRAGEARRRTRGSKVIDRTPGTARTRTLLTTALAAILLAACSSQVIKRGHQFQETDLQQVQAGMSQDQVRMSLGSPATTASVPGGNAYYYISSTATQTAFMPEKEVDRQVVAVYFTQAGTVDKVAQYGMKDGKVFDFISRTTPSPGGREDGILKQLFRNLGQRQLYGE